MTSGVVLLTAILVVVLLMLIVLSRSVRMVPQARARNVERLGRYRKTLEPGLNFVIPVVDRVKALIDLREQVVSFAGQRVITEDNVVVAIDTVLFFQVTDPRAADYEIVNYIQAIEQLAATMLRSVIGSMDLEQTLTSRTRSTPCCAGCWTTPPASGASGSPGSRSSRSTRRRRSRTAMEKQLKAEREKRAAILGAEGQQQAQVLTAEGDRKGNILRAEGEKQAAILRAEGQAQAISTVFGAIHAGNPDPQLLAYQYLRTLPELAQGAGNTVWMIPSELTSALKALAAGFSQPELPAAQPAPPRASRTSPRPGRSRPGPSRHQGPPRHQSRPPSRCPHPLPRSRLRSGPVPGQPWMARPRVSSTPNASCSRPVCPSAPISAGPRAPARTARTGGTASGSVARVSRVSGRDRGDHHRQHGERDQRAAGVQQAGPLVADADRERALARRGVGRDVAQVVDHQQGAGEQPDRDTAATASQVSLPICTYAVPTTAATPKNANTATSPRPR